MAESNATQVILTDDGLKIINAQNTANNAASGVTDLNDPNLMSVIEKQNNTVQFTGLTSQYNVLVQNAKDEGINTTAVTTAYNNLNKFMAGFLADPDHASDVDRTTYKKYQDAYNEELANLQSALQNSTNNKFASAASATSQAASTANVAKSAADSAYAYASSEIAVQSNATDKAQNAADNAFSQAQSAVSTANSTASAFGPVKQNADSALSTALNAQTDASSAVAKAESTASEFGKVSQKADSAVSSAIDAQSNASYAVAQASSAAEDSKDAEQIAGAVNQSYKTLTDGSTMTIAELQSGLAVKLTKADLDGYATQDWSQNQIKTTADGINSNISSIKSTVDGQTTSINDLEADSNGFKDEFTKVNNTIGQHTTDIGTLQTDSSGFKAQFQTVNDTIGKHTTDIGTLQASSKELSSDFSSLSTDNTTNKTNISSLSQTVDGIKTDVSKKLEQKDLNGYATQDWAQNQIKTTADGINGTISSIKSTVDSHTTSINDFQADSDSFKSQFTKVNGTLSQQSTDISTLKADASSLSSNFDSLSSDSKTNQHDIGQLQASAKEVSSTLETVQAQVNNSAVGTNLLLNTSDYSNNWAWDVTPSIDTTQKPTVLHYPSTTITSGTSTIANQIIGTILQPSTTYTVSFYAKGSGSFRFFCYPGVVATASSVNGIVVSSASPDCDTAIPLTSNYVRYTITFTTVSNMGSDDKNFLLRQDYNSSDPSFNTVEAYIYGMKLEKGSVATDWCANPADNATVTALSSLSQTVDGIKTDVSKKIEQKDLNGYATEEWTQNQIKVTADGINGTISSVKSTVDGHTTSINNLQADSSSFKSQFTTVNDTIGKHTTDIGTLQATSKELVSGFNTLTNDNGTNKNNISQLKQTSTELNSTLMTVQTQVQNSAVGTNLLTGTSDFSSNWVGWPEPLSVSTTTEYNGYPSLVFTSTGSLNNQYVGKLENSFQYTASFWAKADNAGDKAHTELWGSVGGTDFVLTTDWVRYSAVVTSYSDANTNASHAWCYFGVPNGNKGNVYIALPKLEKGSLATDWCPNPADNATVTAVSSISQTIDGIKTAVSGKADSSQISQLRNDIDIRVKKDDLISDFNEQAGNTLISASHQLTLSSNTIYFDTANPVIIPSANIDTALVNKTLKAADISANTFTTNNGTFTVDKNGLVTATSLIIRGTTNLVYNAVLAGNNGSYIPGWNISNNGICWSNVMHDGVPSIGWNNTAGGWTNFAQTKLYPLNGATDQPFSASVWFKEDGSDTGLLWNLTLQFFDSNGNRIQGSYVDKSWNGIGSGQDWRYITINNAVAPSNAVYVGLQYFAYNGHGNGCFSSPMLTQTAQATGYQPDTGNVVNAGTVIGTNIIGSNINGTTFHGGNIISDSNNTSNFYPFTIEPTGKASTTLFNSMDALRTEMSGGGLTTMYRAINSSGSQYEAYDGYFSGDMIALNSGFTNGRDMSFSQSVSGNQLTGQVVLSPLNGIHLWGSTQSIHFSGLQMNGTGITFNSYGNIVADQASTWWRIVDFSGNQLANFGTDTAGSNAIQFNRELDIGNFQINTGHTFTSADGGAIHFAKGRGGANDIYAGDVHYNSLVKSSLLSVKKDVQKADTAYWSQLVNSIDLATYQYKSDDNTSHLRLSSIVDDVNDTKQWQLPDVFISRDEDGKLNGVDDSVLLNATLATVQEQQKEISALNGHLLELEAKLNG